MSPRSKRFQERHKYSKSLPAGSAEALVYRLCRARRRKANPATDEDLMRAAYYEKNGPAREVLRVAEVETPQPARGEVRVRLRTSGINPSDVKSRAGLTRKIAFARVIPHS